MTCVRTQPIRIIVRLAVVVAVTMAALGSATALAAPVDKASDRTAVHAFSHYVKATIASLPASKRADEAFVHSISARCGNALARLNSVPVSAGNPKATKTFVEETVLDLADAGDAPLKAPLARLAGALSRTRWSTRQVADAVGAFPAAQHRAFSIAPSNLCADARAFAAHPKVAPAATKHWVAKFQGANRAATRAAFRFGEVLGVFRSPSDAGTLKALGPLTKRLTAATKKLAAAEEKNLLRALGLPA
jgi:hypothetical protein